MEKVYKFYVLSTSTDIDNIRYVGVTTKTVQQRFYGHKYCAMHPEKRGLPVHKWMYKHYQLGEDIIFKQIDTCEEQYWEDREKYWIKYYKDKGFDLLNISQGGNGVVTQEQRSTSSIQRSIDKHKKAVVALNKDGTFYKKWNSAKEATEELQIKSKSAISNVLRGRSKSCAGYLWVYEKDYNPDTTYKYLVKHVGIYVYQFDINGILIKEYPNKRYFDTLPGYSFNGVQNAIRTKSVYHDSYWSTTKTINIDDFEPYYLYQELDSKNNIIELFHTQNEICEKYNVSSSYVCKKLQNNLPIKGHKITKL